jgi:conjugal transfer ATP-binding protein TraC
MLSWLGDKLARLLGEGNTGIPNRSCFEDILKAYGTQPMMADLFPYDSYDETTRLFRNQDSMGFVLETLPLTGASEEMQKEVSSLFQYILPEQSSLQTILWADPHIGDLCNAWQDLRQDKSPVIQKLAQRRAEFLKGMAFESPQSPYVLRNFRCILAYSQPDCGNNPVAVEQITQLISQLKTALEMLRLPVIVWRPEELISTLEGMLCLDPAITTTRQRPWDPLTSLQSQICSAEAGLMVGSNGLSLHQLSPEGKSERAIQVRTYKVRNYPDMWSLHAMSRLVGDNERDMAQIPCPFLIHYGVHIPLQDKPQKTVTTKALYVDTQARSTLAKYLPSLQQESAELTFVRDQLNKGERIVQTHFSIVLFAPGDLLPQAEQIVRNLFQGQEWRLESNRFLHLPMLLSCLPMSWGAGMIKTLTHLRKLKTTLSTESANLLPLQAEWRGTPFPGLILAGRRGQLFTWWPYDSASNYNVCVLGQSGSGKSVFMQEMVMSLLGAGGRVFVLDIGRSFQKLAQILGGEIIQITRRADPLAPPLSLNPFTHLNVMANNDEDRLSHLIMIRQVIASMISPSGNLEELETSFLEIALNTVIADKGAQTEVSDIAAWFLAHADRRANDMGTRLYSFSRDGIYGRYFAGPSTISFSNALVVAEFEDIKQSRELCAVILQILIVHILTLMYRGDRKTRFALIVDEGADFLAGRAGETLVETVARQIRKSGGVLIMGSQNAEDFHKSLAAKAAFNNSAWKFYLSMSNESFQAFEKGGLISSPTMLSLLRTVRMNPGQYGESMIVSDSGYAIGRLILDPFTQLLYSTKAEEFTAIEGLVKQGLPVDVAIDRLLTQRKESLS